MVGCPAIKSKHRGLSFHKLPKVGVDDAWREALIKVVNRSDKSFNPNRATICSRHFTADCFYIRKYFVEIIHYQKYRLYSTGEFSVFFQRIGISFHFLKFKIVHDCFFFRKYGF